jgi:hypothetical protein
MHHNILHVYNQKFDYKPMSLSHTNYYNNLTKQVSSLRCFNNTVIQNNKGTTTTSTTLKSFIRHIQQPARTKSIRNQRRRR